MKLKEIVSDFKQLKVKETRCLNDEYVEIVFFNKDIGAWHDTLVAHLGEPRKPAGKEPTPADLELTSDSGGIWGNQTLFEKFFGEVTVIAKFWPWGDEVHTTLKMALLIH